MIRFIVSLVLSLALFVSQASAGFLLNSYAVKTPLVLTFLQCSGNSAGGTSPITVSAQNVGTASSDRYTIVVVNSRDSASVYDITSLTVDGDSATEVADYGAASSTASAAIYILSNPSGTSEDVIINASEIIASVSVCIWSVTGLQSATAADTATGGSSTNAAISLNIDLPDGGFGVAGCGASVSSTQSVTWTGFNEVHDVWSLTPANLLSTAAEYTATTAETNKSVSADTSGSGQTGCAAASFR